MCTPWPEGTNTLIMAHSNKTICIVRKFSCSHYSTAKTANTMKPCSETTDKAPFFARKRAETDLVPEDWLAQNTTWRMDCGERRCHLDWRGNNDD